MAHSLSGPGVVPTGTTAVTLNVTATNGTGPTYVTVYPDGVPRPVASNTNPNWFTMANLVTVAVSPDRKVDLYNHVGSLDLIADLAGYYVPGAGAQARSRFGDAVPDRLGHHTGCQRRVVGDPLYRVRAGGHGCFDRVVFDVNGPGNVGYVVRYAPVVLSDPKGEPLPVPGGAVLQVVILAGQSGPTFGRTGDYLIPPRRVAGRTVLRAVRFAGSFEGQCTFAVGVRAVLPFRVFTVLDRRDQVRQVVVDIARR